MQRIQRMLSVACRLVGAASWLAASPAAASPAAAQRHVAASAPASASASVPPVALAERYAEEAFQAYERKDYEGAVALYHKALEAAPSADIIYNLARVYDLGLQDHSLAMRFYARYLDDPGRVTSRVETSRRRLAELEAAERAELQAAVVPSGAAHVPAPANPRGGSATPALAVAAGGLGLVGIGIGVGFGITAKSRLDVSRRYCDDNSCTSMRGVDAAQSAARAADVATVGFVAGGALLALGTVLWIVADGEAEAAQTAPELRWTPRVSPQEVSLGVSGSFAGL